MRRAIHDLAGRAAPDHIGLAYDRWAPLDPSTGKVKEADRRGWLEGLSGKAVPEHYALAYRTWLSSLRKGDSRAVEVEFATRLLVGHGNASPTGVGLTVHHTWGVPILSGSALKGVLSHYVSAVYGSAALDVHPMDPAVPEEERARAPYQGVTWCAQGILHGPGEIYRAMFGAPAAKTDEKYRKHGAGETAGLLIFHDALFVPGSVEHPFAADVLTVHQRRYYDHRGEEGGPTDHDDPNPVSFLTVRPGARFLLALSGPEAWMELALSWLRDALVGWGIGGKTSSGYGRIRPDVWRDVVPSGGTSPPERREASVVGELRAWFERAADAPAAPGKPTQREQLAALRSDWLPRLQALDPAERAEAGKLIRREISNKKLTPDRDDLLRAIAEGSTSERA